MLDSRTVVKRTLAGIAQLVEQRTENPRVTSSSLVPGISSGKVNTNLVYFTSTYSICIILAGKMPAPQQMTISGLLDLAA
jgi:hypothetical protein